MKKAKKYIYPILFSVGFIVFWTAVVEIINTKSSGESYAGLGIGILILFAWLFIILPIYCIIYGKIIIKEKLKFLFPFYNALVLSCFYLLPFSLEDETYIYALILFTWVLFWGLIPLLIKFDSTKKQDNNDSNEIQE